jgi:hypothetical protein
MGDKNKNLNEEFFQLELQRNDSYRRNISRKIIKSAEKRLTKIFLNHIDGKNGEC